MPKQKTNIGKVETLRNRKVKNPVMTKQYDVFSPPKQKKTNFNNHRKPGKIVPADLESLWLGADPNKYKGDLRLGILSHERGTEGTGLSMKEGVELTFEDIDF